MIPPVRSIVRSRVGLVSVASVTAFLVGEAIMQAVIWIRRGAERAAYGPPTGAHGSVLEQEQRTDELVKEALAARDLVSFDSLGALRDALGRGRPLYPATDGHPSRDGHAVLAGAIGRELERRGWEMSRSGCEPREAGLAGS